MTIEMHRTQAVRRERTRQLLVSAARRLFAQQGYAATSTPDIATAAGVTRGALYHHFSDKLALFTAVVQEEHLLLAMMINAANASDEPPGLIKALMASCDAYLDAMQDIGRRQILLIDAPAVLGRDAVDEIEARHRLDALTSTLRDAMETDVLRALPVDALARLISAIFDRAALASPAEVADYRKAIKALIRGLRI